MAEELFQFLLKLKESGVDLSKIEISYDEDVEDIHAPFSPVLANFYYYEDTKELFLKS